MNPTMTDIDTRMPAATTAPPVKTRDWVSFNEPSRLPLTTRALAPPVRARLRNPRPSDTSMCSAARRLSKLASTTESREGVADPAGIARPVSRLWQDAARHADTPAPREGLGAIWLTRSESESPTKGIWPLGRGVVMGEGAEHRNGRLAGTSDAPEIPEAPGDLGAAGLAVWGWVCSEQQIREADRLSVERLCRLEDEASSLRAVLAADGPVSRRPMQNSRAEAIGEDVCGASGPDAVAENRDGGGNAVQRARLDTFSCDAAYSSSPTALTASPRVRKLPHQTHFPRRQRATE